ncbi:MAG: succinyl-diaminopimelate desuccinylase [Glaciihabitans sp.]
MSAPVASSLDPIVLTQELIRCKSVTPADDGALDVVERELLLLGFTVDRLEFDGTPNLFARRGTSGPHLCFAGHTDVVPAGNGFWSSDPFAGDIHQEEIVGRGASDMKGAISAFLAAVSRTSDDDLAAGSVSLLITGDEEGPATGGTVRVLEWMEQHGHIPDFCVVGEGTNVERIGDTIKVGRRGSLNAGITVRGVQGHVAYPHRSVNPVHLLARFITELVTDPLDDGSEFFEPSSLQVTTVDVGNPATNLVPAVATGHVNIRFNDRHTGASLSRRLREIAARHSSAIELDITISGEPFLTPPGASLQRLIATIESVTGVTPALDTAGGTSDARFIAKYAPVAEFGLLSATIHQADERVKLTDLATLADCYQAFISSFLRRKD